MLAQSAQGPGFKALGLIVHPSEAKDGDTHTCKPRVQERQKFKVMLSELEANLGHTKRLSEDYLPGLHSRLGECEEEGSPCPSVFWGSALQMQARV